MYQVISNNMDENCMDRRMYFLLIVIATLPLIASPAAASLYLNGESFTPHAPLVPGAGQHFVATFTLLPAGSTTFIRGHELQMQTDLVNAQWNIQVIDNGHNAAQQSASGNAAFVNGMILSYPNSHDVALSITIDGTVPSTPGVQVPVLQLEEIDNSGNIVPGSIVTVVQPVAGQTISPSYTPLPTLTSPPGSSSPTPARADGFTLVSGVLAISLPGFVRLMKGKIRPCPPVPLPGQPSSLSAFNGFCMFESIGRSFALVKTSWNILMQDKKLLAFPVLSGIVTLLVLLTFAVPFIVIPLMFSGQLTGLSVTNPAAFYVLLFAFYVVSYFVVIFFNTALISCVNARLNGKDMTVTEGLSAAAGHFWSVLAWAIVSATIGIILHMIEERTGFVGQIVAGVVGGAWALVTYFVVPALVLEDKGVVESVKESVTLIKKTWGESIVGAGSIMLIFVAIGIVAFLGIFGVIMFSHSIILTGVAIAFFVIIVAILAVLASAMQGIFVTALYTYAKTGTVPSAFDKDLIQNAFAPKPVQPGNI